MLLLLNSHQDPSSKVVACINLFFMKTYLFAIITKHSLKPIERVQMMWHSLLWLLHIDGLPIITKNNYLSECVSLLFLILRNVITQPHTLTIELSEHANSLMRGMKRDFNVKDHVFLVAKLDRFWEAIVIGGGLNLSRKVIQEPNHTGYDSSLSAPTATSVEKGQVMSGPVQMNENSDLFPLFQTKFG